MHAPDTIANNRSMLEWQKGSEMCCKPIHEWQCAWSYLDQEYCPRRWQSLICNMTSYHFNQCRGCWYLRLVILGSFSTGIVTVIHYIKATAQIRTLAFSVQSIAKVFSRKRIHRLYNVQYMQLKKPDFGRSQPSSSMESISLWTFLSYPKRDSSIFMQNLESSPFFLLVFTSLIKNMWHADTL